MIFLLDLSFYTLTWRFVFRRFRIIISAQYQLQ